MYETSIGVGEPDTVLQSFDAGWGWPFLDFSVVHFHSQVTDYIPQELDSITVKLPLLGGFYIVLRSFWEG